MFEYVLSRRKKALSARLFGIHAETRIFSFDRMLNGNLEHVARA